MMRSFLLIFWLAVSACLSTAGMAAPEGEGMMHVAKWPVGLRLVKREPLTVELVIENNTDRIVQFHKPSIGFGGRITNKLFVVKADGVEIPYGGMMKKRAPPDDFLKLKPLEEFHVTLDLSADYDIPRTAKKIEVRFEHTNHFSADDFQLYSPIPLVIK